MWENAVVAYESRKMKPHEKNYVVYDLELAAIIHDIKMGRHYLLGKTFTLVTNQMSLKYFSSQPNLNARKARWLSFLSEFEFDIKHIKWKVNKIEYARIAHSLIGVSVSSISTHFVE